VGWDFDNIENRLSVRKQMLTGFVDHHPGENGLTTTRMTIPIISSVGTSLIIR
jgi:hypothetical protein